MPYFSLEEDPDTRAFAIEDPRAFLRQAADGAVLDEVQRAPELFSYLQGVVDANCRIGRFILTGSSQFELIESITQSLAAFQRFVQLCAGRIGQLLNISSLAADSGITGVTAEAWLSVLQASHLVFFVRPWFTNRNKRHIKTPPIYFCDPGLDYWFLGVRDTTHVTAHPLRGALFENWVMTELLKAQKDTYGTAAELRAGWKQSQWM